MCLKRGRLDFLSPIILSGKRIENSIDFVTLSPFYGGLPPLAMADASVGTDPSCPI